MRGELLLFLGSVLACQNTFFASSEVLPESSNEPFLKVTQTDKRLGAIIRQINELKQLNSSKNHLPAFAFRPYGCYSDIDNFCYKFEDFFRIERIVKFFYDHIEVYEQFENRLQIRHANKIVTNESNDKSLRDFHYMIFGSDVLGPPGETLFSTLVDGYKKYPNMTCSTPQSPQQHLYLLYVDIVLTELRFIAKMEWAWLVLEHFGRTWFLEQRQEMWEGFERRMNRTRNLMKDQIIGADRTIWRCDPTRPKLGVTYEMVTRLLQGYIENEEHLSAENTCRHDCAYYQSTESEGCHADEFCSKQPRCRGRLHNCQFFESNLRVCQSEKDSHRRYDFFEGYSGYRRGGAEGCSREMDKAESWHSWFFKCDYCFCLCDEEGPQSDRYFNLRPVSADIARNRVVTGLRFIKHNRIFHLQIQEGELLAHGVINETTLKWKPLDSYSISDKDVKKDVDYHALSYENRSINLVEVKEHSNFLVTGLRFQVVGGHLNLEAQFTGFDFKSGQLTEKTYWSSAGIDKGRRKLAVKDFTEAAVSSEPYPSDNDQYVEFTNSDLEKDAAQTTVPYIDIQEVVSEPAVPISGIGVYYKGSKGYSGYVAPKLITYDFSEHVELPTMW